MLVIVCTVMVHLCKQHVAGRSNRESHSLQPSTSIMMQHFTVCSLIDHRSTGWRGPIDPPLFRERGQAMVWPRTFSWI